MPAWWGKKSTKNKETQSKEKERDKYVKPRSFDEVLCRNSPRNSKDLNFGGSGCGFSGSGFSGFDSGSSLDKAHPLPRPSVGNDQGVVLGCGSVSVSSTSSSGSSDGPVNTTDQAQFDTLFRGNGDNRLSPLSRSPVRSRGTTTTSSPLHPRFSSINLDSPTGKLDNDVRSECHQLPLPPGSPPSPSALPNPRPCGVAEGSTVNMSKWKKGRLLGRGTFGHVYLGFNRENGQMCAIKEVRVVSDDQTSKECLKQLNQEIILLSNLTHPNIVRYYGSELDEETLSVYLEYVSGGSIHKLLQEYGAFREPVIQNYTRQILSGLSFLHARNTVHRDIKGANILVDPNGEIKLADFGMAKHITSCSSVLSFKGSPYWMAPEVVMNTSGYGLPVDIWSLGCTILEMASSKPPWSQYEGVAAIFKIGNSKDFPEIPDHLSNDAKNFIKLCLQREPSARPTASQLLEQPFVKNQSTAKVAHVGVTKEAYPRSFDGSRTPPVLDMQSGGRNISPSKGNYASHPVITISRPLSCPREIVKTITSLPVSPTSSPLRQYEPARRSCYLSPPHPAYGIGGQSGYDANDYSMFQTRPTTRSTLEPWLEIPQFKAQTPSRSPKTRPIL
ncbi:mitogen-activated protein kinase kinase kinase 3-like [Nicotiana tabacum]|uniref:mitogen-activated protein kinase kinase kinase n=1 Tax=Nicotiana tabacum TaxID=4097 RepID=A0A1S4AMN6_TOBAC|nr:PREDICTED: mitogen-activated protein kinase kinase kinase YODA-like [Nicotiana tabacum]